MRVVLNTILSAKYFVHQFVMFIKNEQTSKVNKLHLLQFCSANIPNIIMSWADYDWDFDSHSTLFYILPQTA